MSDPGWGLHNFDLALKRWIRHEKPSDALVEQVKNWRSGIEQRGVEVIERWAVISDDDDFVARIPGTSVMAAGQLLAYEQLVIMRSFQGRD